MARNPDHRPLLTGAQQDMLFAGLAALMPLLAVHAGPEWRTLYRIGLLAMLYLFLAAVVAAAVLRQEVVTTLQTCLF